MRNPIELLRRQTSIFPDHYKIIGLDEYQGWTQLTDKKKDTGFDGLGFILLGLFGESGSLLSELKKKQRDEDSYVAYRESVIEELGDTLWYFSNASAKAGLKLSEIVSKIGRDITEWDSHHDRPLTTFVDLQNPKTDFKEPLSSHEVENEMLKLAGKIGLLLDQYADGYFHTNRDALSAALIEIFRKLVIAANGAHVSLNESALRNVEKTFGRWPNEIHWPPLYDIDPKFDETERIPRLIKMNFFEKEIAGKKYVFQRCNDINIGDRLTDNRHEPDDYRFHDVFHLAYAAILGWSPVIRALFKVKRKSDQKLDENEDGARAILIEEGVATWIFNHASRHQHFRNVQSLDYNLLKAVKELVRGYEVETRELWQWERAILEGFKIFREIIKPENRGGLVIADIEKHTIRFEKHDQASQ